MRHAHLILLPLILLGLWLLLNQSVSPGHVALGTVLALWLGWASTRLRPLRAKPRRIWLLVALVPRLVLDVTKSNIAVAKLIWRPGRELTPGFITIPIKLRDPHALAILACCLTYTPGTVVVDIKRGENLSLHVLDLQNEAHWVSFVQDRYERVLLEVFQ